MLVNDFDRKIKIFFYYSSRVIYIKFKSILQKIDNFDK